MLRFHPDKCKVLNIHNKWKESDSYRYTMEKYDKTTAILEGVDLEKDIGVNIQQSLIVQQVYTNTDQLGKLKSWHYSTNIR